VTSWNHFVNDTEFEKLLRTVEPPTANHCIGDTLASASYEKTHAPHSRKHVEENFRKTSTDRAFGHNDIARKRALKPSAQRISLE